MHGALLRNWSLVFTEKGRVIDIDLTCCPLKQYLFIIIQHWIANNLLGFAFAVNGIELLHLNNVVTGCILLGGLFFYDIFWVFGTNVMVTVAKSFEAPIKCKYIITPFYIILNYIK